jgi:hypothetical protein
MAGIRSPSGYPCKTHNRQTTEMAYPRNWGSHDGIHRRKELLNEAIAVYDRRRNWELVGESLKTL